MSGNIGGAGGSRHLNTGDILTWVAEHTSQLGDSIAQSMFSANQRADQIEQLTKLKADLNDIKQHGGYGARAEEIQSFLDSQADAPNHDELCAKYGPIRDELMQAQKDWDKAESSGNAAAKTQVREKMEKLIPGYVEQTDAMLEGIKKQDQLAMLYLQNDTSRMNQAMQQASNVMAGINSAAMNILGNIRG